MIPAKGDAEEGEVKVNLFKKKKFWRSNGGQGGNFYVCYKGSQKICKYPSYLLSKCSSNLLLGLQEKQKLSFLSLTLNMVLFAEALSEATSQGINEKTTLLWNLWDFSSNMAQFFHSKTVVNSILFVGKTWNFLNFTKKDAIKDFAILVNTQMS